MAKEEALQNISLPVHADYSTAGQFRFVSVNSSGRAQLTGDGAQADGVLQDKPSAQDAIGTVAISGVSKVQVGAAGVTAGALVASDASGDAVDAVSGDNIVGVALATGVDNDLVPVLLKCQNANAIA